MIKVLILAYDFPPLVSVGGLRPYSWYRYLMEYGVFPIVVTRQWQNKHGNNLDYISPGVSEKTIFEETEFGLIIKTPYHPNISNRILLKYGENKFIFLRKFFTAFFEFFQFVFFIGPKVRLFFEAREYLNKNKVDAIIATGDPFILFRYASVLSRRFSIPWIADYRDPWLQDKSRKKIWLYRIGDGYFERKYLKNASLITTVSDFFREQIVINLQKKTFRILPNGYDEALMSNRVPQVEKSDKLILAFAGTIYPWHPWRIFLSAISEWQRKNEKNEIEIRFIGINLENDISQFVSEKHPGLFPCLIFRPKLGINELGIALSKANVFLLFNDYSIAGTKIFDYLALKRKVLLCFKKDLAAMDLKNRHFHLEEFSETSNLIQEDIIAKTNGGIIVQDSHHLLQVLDSLWSELIQNGHIDCPSRNVEQFSRKKQVKKLADILKSLSD